MSHDLMMEEQPGCETITYWQPVNWEEKGLQNKNAETQ